MIPLLSGEAEAAFRAMCKRAMAPPQARSEGTLLDRSAIEVLLPHRDPFLLLDHVSYLDAENELIVAHYDLARARDVFAGHFPGTPLWPGVLQLEAIGQAGILLTRAASSPAAQAPAAIALTQVLGAQFMRPVTPGGEVEIVARLIPDGLFTLIVGQCLHGGEVCSAAALRGLSLET